MSSWIFMLAAVIAAMVAMTIAHLAHRACVSAAAASRDAEAALSLAIDKVSLALAELRLDIEKQEGDVSPRRERVA